MRFSKEIWSNIRLLFYLIAFSSATLVKPELIIYTGPGQLILALTELVFVLYVPRPKKIPVQIEKDLEDFD